MKWNNHKEYEGKHAFLGASNYHWLGYDQQTLGDRYYNQFSQIIGTALHQLAHECILSRTKLTKHDVHLVDNAMFRAFVPKDAYDPNELLSNLVPFVNDAIGFHMSSEILLFVSPLCFGTTDAIKYDDLERVLRIHDLKSGLTPAKMDQLYIYAAMFCKEYNVNPKRLKQIECRIYQNNMCVIDNPSPDIILDIMNKIDEDVSLITTYLERDGR